MKRRKFLQYAAMGSACFAGIFGRNLTFAISSANGSQSGTSSEIIALMSNLRIPGVSVAIIDDFEIVDTWVSGFIINSPTAPPVTTATLFQAASISKPVVAATALRLVEEGRLALDRNVNDYLTTWELEENIYTRQQSVTLRHILTHSSGLNVRGFEGYAEGDELPTLFNILNGEPPANSERIRVVAPPGQCSYSGGGYTVLQQLLVEVAWESFPSLIQSLVLRPAGMTASTFENFTLRQTYAFAQGREAIAYGHYANGNSVLGGWHTYPEMAAAGLWTTPSDLARYAISLMEAGLGRRTHFLGPETAQAMMNLQACGRGLGFVVEGTGYRRRFSHSGSNAGYHAYLIGYPETGQGAVIMVNSDNGWQLIQEVIGRISESYNWPI